MASGSNSDVPTPKTTTNDAVLTSINKHLQKLRKQHNLILRKHESIQKKSRKLRCFKDSVAAKIAMLEKLFEEFSSISTGPVYMAPALVTPSQETESVGLFKADLRSIMNDDETKEPRYLCVSNGCVVCCLDLKRGQGQSLINARDVPPLPKITTLKLMDERLPVSVGLFKSGSHAYMIGGQHFPTSVEDPGNYTDPFFLHDWGENPRGYYLYRTICSLHCCKGTSNVTYCLSLKDGATLSHSPSNTIAKLNKPKFWPIVEKIKGQIHVIDSYPSEFDDDPNCDWVFSHEVLKQVSRRCSWVEIPTPNEEIYIRSHAVVGDRIYAVGAGKFVVFDSKTQKWEARPAKEWQLPLSAKKVWHILQLGIARCAGEFPLKESDRLYVLIAVLRDALNDDCGTFAVAYLVTSTGRVVCVQRLPRFFEKPVEPWCMLEGTIIDVDEEGKTMCCIVNGTALLNGKKVDFEWTDYLFINTFAVEMRTDAAPKIRQVRAQGSKAWPVELDFVRVDIEDNDRHVYKTDAKLEGEGDLPGFPGLQACFL